MNSITWPVKALSACEIVVKASKKIKNDILHVWLGDISESHSNQISSIIDNIYDNSSKIFFCEIYIKVKIIRNPSKKPISAVIEKLERVYMNLLGPMPDILLQGNW